MTTLRSHLVSLMAAAGLALAGVSGCSLDPVNEPIPQPDPGDEDGDDGPGTTPLPGTACKAILGVSGTFAPGDVAEPPELEGGCWPFGTWTLNVTVTDDGGCAEVPVESEYVYQVDAGEEYEYIITYVSDPDAEAYFKISQLGGGECQGSFEHPLPGATLELKPYVHTETSTQIQGDGIYEVFAE